MGLVKDLRFCQFLVLYKIHQEKLFGYIFVKQHYHYYGDDDDDDDAFNKPLMEFFILCFYVVPSSTTTAPPTEQTTKTTSSEKITSTGNEKPEGKLGTSTAQRRKGNQKTELKNTSVKILFSLALLSGLFTAPLLKNPLALFLFFLTKGNGLQYGRILCFD